VKVLAPIDYHGRYRDRHGEEPITLHHRNGELTTIIRGVALAGRDFDGLEPADRAAAAAVGLVLDSIGDLCDCVLAWEMPVLVEHRGDVAAAPLSATLELGPPGPRGGADREELRLELRWHGAAICSPGRDPDFESALGWIAAHLPDGARLRACLTCACSDYSPAGQGLFGSLTCFRATREQYLAVASKDDLFALWPRAAGPVAETGICPEFSPRVPGTGYRG
jgi:hypothetical protein